jgi:1,4-alpha-glucan branching enzyme
MKETRMILLGLLRRGPLYGYQIKKLLQEEQFAPWAVVPVASLYHELAVMAAEGLITESANTESAPGRPARTSYRLTDQGHSALLDLLRSAWADIEPARSPQDIAAFFMDALPDQEAIEALRGRMQRLGRELSRLQEAVSHHLQQPGVRPVLAAILEHARLRLQSELAWTRDLLARLAAGEPKGNILAQPTLAPSPRVRVPRTTTGLGAFTFVLHTHLPYCRMAGRWPHGEEWIHEAAAEAYVPLLNALYDLRDEGVDFRLTMSLTPVLTEQLADADVKAHFLSYLESEIKGAQRDIPRFGEADNAQLEYLAGYYRDYYTWVRDSYLQRFDGDMIGAFRRLQDEGYLEIITCAATHGYLPLLARDSSIYAQLRAGVESYQRHFGRAPRAIWLPECAYRPAYVDEQNVVRPALEEFLAALGITCFFVETHAIEGGRPVGKAAGDVAIGPYTAITRQYVIPVAEAPSMGGTTFAAYHVVGNAQGLTNPPVTVIGRNNRTGQQVWSGDWGYPGDADYREFHKKDEESGLQYWRVTGPRVDLGSKDYYHPDWAAHKVGEHARHYADLVEQLVRDYHAENGRYGIVSSNYDTELFGHWWFEGITWIKEVLRNLSTSTVVDLTTASAYVTEHSPDQVMAVPESSWGAGGTHWTWDNPDTHWVWEPIHAAEGRMERLVVRYPAAEGDLLAVLNQAARELLLLEASDWPFLMTTGQAKEYATLRFRSHLSRFERLAHMAEAGLEPDARTQADELYELDKVFPSVDYRWFKSRQGQAWQ